MEDVSRSNEEETLRSVSANFVAKNPSVLFDFHYAHISYVFNQFTSPFIYYFLCTTRNFIVLQFSCSLDHSYINDFFNRLISSFVQLFYKGLDELSMQ